MSVTDDAGVERKAPISANGFATVLLHAVYHQDAVNLHLLNGWQNYWQWLKASSVCVKPVPELAEKFLSLPHLTCTFPNSGFVIARPVYFFILVGRVLTILIRENYDVPAKYNQLVTQF